MADNNYDENMCQYIRPKKASNDRKRDQNNGSDWQLTKSVLFKKMWSKIDKKMRKVRTESHTKLKQSVAKCLENHSSNECNQSVFKPNKFSKYGLIPTVVINLGSSTSEHKYFYDSLLENFDDISSSPYIYLSSTECSSISSVVNIISDFIITDDIKQSLNLKDSQLKNFTFGTLIKVYKEHIIKIDKNNVCPPLVFFVSNIDNFDNLVLTHLITILKEYTETLPINLIMSACNSWTSLQHMLPSHATDCLEIHFLNSVPAYQTFEDLFDKAIIHYKIPFNITPKVLNFIFDSHVYFDYSIDSVRHLLKYALFEHYYANPLSILCQPMKDLEKYIKKLNDADLNLFRNNVFNKSTESMNGKQFKKHLIESIEEFQTIIKEYVKQIKILCLLLKEIGIKPAISFPNLYIIALSKSSELNDIVDSLNNISQTKWKSSLESCLANSALCDESLSLVKTLNICLTDLNKLENEPTEVAEKPDISHMKETLNALTRQQLRNKLNPKNNPKTLSKFDVWKQNTLDSLVNTLTELNNPLDNPLHQIFYFDDLKLLNKHTICSPRDEIKNTLSDPSIRLNIDKIENSRNDFFTMYTLYEEHQSIINMYECFEAFKSFNEEVNSLASHSKRKKQINKDNGGDIDKKIIARFLNIVSDFEYIGLIEPAKRKTDHLLKLVWF